MRRLVAEGYASEKRFDNRGILAGSFAGFLGSQQPKLLLDELAASKLGRWLFEWTEPGRFNDRSSNRTHNLNQIPKPAAVSLNPIVVSRDSSRPSGTGLENAGEAPDEMPESRHLRASSHVPECTSSKYFFKDCRLLAQIIDSSWVRGIRETRKIKVRRPAQATRLVD
jgi:hypothetical protein